MATLDQLVHELERSYTELQERMADPAVYSDHREAAGVGRRLKELEQAHRLALDWRATQDDLAAAKDDPELQSLASDLEEEAERLADELKLALVEHDPADEKDVLVEIRQGVGGDEAALWAADVTRMLTRYAERRGFRAEPISVSESDGGGVKEAWDLFIGATHEEIMKRAFQVPAERTEIVPSLLGDDAGMIGAAAGALQKIRSA